MRKKILSYICAGISLLILSACTANPAESSSSAETTAAPPETTTAAVTTVPESPPPTTAVNLLTGKNDLPLSALNKRPVAVMINNNKKALPQYGIAAADVILEAPVEGGITRLMAIYPDYANMPNVCSIRSCRYYFPLVANGMDAVYIHWGSDPTIGMDTLKRLGITRFDGDADGAPIFGRDAERKKTYALEHTGYLNGTELAKTLNSGQYRADLKEGYNKTFFTFHPENASQTPQGVPAAQATLRFSKEYFSTFTYDAASSSYLKQHNGSPHMDSAAGQQLAFTNVIILQTTVSLRSDGSRLDIGLSSGTGKYLSNGTAEDINWSKADDNSNFVLTKTDGTPLFVNTGKSYIALIGYDKTISLQ